MKNLSKEELEEELEKCKNSVSYFYNNYCRKEGMPEYSEEAFQEYIKEAENARQRNGYNRRGKVMLMREFPFTPNECIKPTETVDPKNRETESDKLHLDWIYKRLIFYDENPNVDYMLRFKAIIDKF